MKHHQSVYWVTLNDMHAQHMFLVIKGPCIIIQVKEGRKEGSYPQGQGPRVGPKAEGLACCCWPYSLSDYSLGRPKLQLIMSINNI